MEPTAQESISTIAAKETWTMEDHNQLAKELFRTPDAPRKFRSVLAEMERANPQPKGGAAMKIGIARYMLCRIGDALEAFAEATDNKDRRFFMALCYKASHLYDKAAEEFDRALSKGYDELTVAIQQAEVMILKGDLDAARKAVSKLTSKIGTKADYFYLLGLIEDLGGKKEKAIENYDKALSIESGHVGATFHLAYLYDLHGEEEEAVRLYKECIARPPVFANALMNLAVLYEDTGRYDRSAQCLETILLNNPGHLRARLFLKDIQASQVMYYDEEQAKRVARRNAVLDIPVTDFELSVRARNCLKKMNIRSLGDLVRTSEPELLAYKNFGETSLKEIKEMLSAKGLHLGQATEEGGELAPTFKPAPVAAPAGQEGVMNTSIDNLEFSIRSRRALQGLNIKTLGDLAAKSEAELLGCKNFGQTSLNEIRQRLSEYGLNLRES